MDLKPAMRPSGGRDARAMLMACGEGRRLEKLEEASRFGLTHGRTEQRAHPNLIEIKAFGRQPLFDYGSTSIMETL